MRIAACALLSVASVACQVLIDVDSQCASTADCVLRFGPDHVCGPQGACAVMANVGADGQLPLPWECLDSPVQRGMPDPDRTVHVRLNVYDDSDGHSLEGVTVRVCSRTDVACSAVSRSDKFTSDQDGTVEMDLEHGFAGHFELAGDGVMPLILYDIPFVDDATVVAPMITMESLAANVASGGEAYSEERGLLLLTLFDCSGMPAEGIRLDAPGDPDIRPFYFNGPLPSREVQSTVVSQVGARSRPLAMAGFPNLEPGFPTVRGFLAGTDRMVGRITRRVAPGAVTRARFQGGY